MTPAAIIRANHTTWPRTIAWGLLWAIGAASWIVLGSMWA